MFKTKETEEKGVTSYTKTEVPLVTTAGNLAMSLSTCLLSTTL